MHLDNLPNFDLDVSDYLLEEGDLVSYSTGQMKNSSGALYKPDITSHPGTSFSRTGYRSALRHPDNVLCKWKAALSSLGYLIGKVLQYQNFHLPFLVANIGKRKQIWWLRDGEKKDCCIFGSAMVTPDGLLQETKKQTNTGALRLSSSDLGNDATPTRRLDILFSSSSPFLSFLRG